MRWDKSNLNISELGLTYLKNEFEIFLMYKKIHMFSFSHFKISIKKFIILFLNFSCY